MCGFISDVVQTIFGGGAKESPAPVIPALPPLPSPIDTSKENAAALSRRAEEERRAKARAGAASTTVTNPLGIVTPATVEKPTLLGLAK
jgi:hypothetical protein